MYTCISSRRNPARAGSGCILARAFALSSALMTIFVAGLPRRVYLSITLCGTPKTTWMGLYTHQGHPDLLPRQVRLLLNLAEMWPCCIFQTLTANHLNKYLPDHYQKPWAGCHLNIALPLLQPFSVKEKAEAEVLRNQGSFKEYVTANPNDREWATDPVIRGYHMGKLRENLKAAHDATQQKTIESMREYLSGKQERITTNVFTPRGYSWDRTWLACGGFQIAISVDFGLNLHQGDSVFVQLHLAEAIHPYKYTTLAMTPPADSQYQ